MRLYPSRNSQPDSHLPHLLQAWLPFFMKVRMNLQISLFSPCKGSRCMGLISEGSLSTAFRENYTLIQTAGDMKKKKKALGGARCFLLEALREKRRRINSTTGSMIIMPTKYTSLSATQPQDWVHSDRFRSEIASTVLCCCWKDVERGGFRQFPQSPGSLVASQMTKCISLFSAHEKLFCVCTRVHMRTHTRS